MNDEELYVVPEEVPLGLFERAHEFDPVSLARSKSGGWSASIPMETGQPGPSTGPALTLAKSEVYTVRFGIAGPSTGGSADSNPYGNTVHAVAKILSFVEGNAIERRISVCHGAAITVTAQAVQVIAYDLSVQTDDEVSDGLLYQVLVHIVPGDRAGYGTPPSLFAFTDVIAGEAEELAGQITLTTNQTARYPIPPNAGVISVEVTVTGDGECTVSAVGGNIVMKSWDPTINTGFVILPPSCTYLEVTNTGGEATSIKETTTWGIEG